VSVLTLSEVVSLLDELGGAPQVLVEPRDGASPVRWVHVSELTDISSLLRGGELILTTGIALPRRPAELRRYVRSLAEAGASGLVVELGRRWPLVPDALLQQARTVALPLIALHQPVPFVAVTERVHTSIVNAQYELLQQSEAAHTAFTALSVEGASAADVVARAASMTGGPVVLEDMTHRAIASTAPSGSTADLLVDWEQRSRAAPGWDRTSRCGPEGWLVTPVGPIGRRWARLVMPTAPDDRPVLALVLERAAEALALNRLVERDEAGVHRQAHRSLIQSLLGDRADGRAIVDADVRARARALGLLTDRRAFTGVALWSPVQIPPHSIEGERRDRALTDAVAAAVHSAGLSALVATGEPSQVLLVLSTRRRDHVDDDLHQLSDLVADQLRGVGLSEDYCLGVGHQVDALSAIGASLTLAGHVADVALSLRGSDRRAFHRSNDVRLRGVLSALGSDPRLTSFAEAELAPLRDHDAAHGTDLVETLRVHLRHRGNKSDQARAQRLSRPALYARLDKIEAVLGVSLGDAESTLSLHVALLVGEVERRGTGG
jgi:purine catabolism regulator